VTNPIAPLNRLLTPRRIRAYTGASLAFTVGAYVIMLFLRGDPPYDGFGRPIAVDFLNRFVAGRIAATGQWSWLYSVPLQIEIQRRVLGDARPQPFAPFISPPVTALLYAPLTSIPYVAAAVVWILGSAGVLLISIKLLWPLIPRLHRYGALTVLLVLLSSWPVVELLFDGQDSALSLAIIVIGLRLLLSKRELAAGLVLGLGAFKPQVFLFVPFFLLVQKRWLSIGGWLATTFALAMLSVMLVGFEGAQSYLALLNSDIIREGTADLSWKMVSLPALARDILSGPFLPFSMVTATAIDLFVLAHFVRAGLSSRGGSADTPRLFALAVVSGALASPYLFVYDGTTLIVPALLLLNAKPDSVVLRMSLTATYILLWSAPIRNAAFGTSAWPIATIAAPWAACSIALMVWFAGHSALSEPNAGALADTIAID
jgi:hypothetical protein